MRYKPLRAGKGRRRRVLTWIVTGAIVWAVIAIATFALLSAAGRADRMSERRKRRGRAAAEAARARPPGEEAAVPPGDEGAARPGDRQRLSLDPPILAAPRRRGQRP
jgi:hypothetical protein